MTIPAADKAAMLAKAAELTDMIKAIAVDPIVEPPPIDIPPVPDTGDGSAGAPVGGVRPWVGIFSGFPARPAWKLPGIDYPVGHTGPLKDWRTVTGRGISVDTGTGRLRIDGSTGIVLDSIDFAAGGGGAQILIVDSNDTKIVNCNLVNGGTSNRIWTAGLIQTSGNCSGLSVVRTTIDGSAPTYVGGSGLITAGGGRIIVQYCHLIRSPQHALELGGASMSLDHRWNLIEDIGNVGVPTAHPNVLQFGGGTWATGADMFLYDYNVVKQRPGLSASGEGVQTYRNNSASPIPGVRIRKNLFWYPGGPDPNIPAQRSGSYIFNLGSGPGEVSDNWVNAAGAYGVVYPGHPSGWMFARNMNAVTGQALVLS